MVCSRIINKESGAAERIGELVSGMGLTGGVTTVFVIITVTLLMSDVTSNTATAAVANTYSYIYSKGNEFKSNTLRLHCISRSKFILYVTNINQSNTCWIWFTAKVYA